MRLLSAFVVTAALLAGGSALAKNPVMVMETSHGTVEMELFEDKAPISVKNFLSYADAGHYDGTVFHRVIKNFMVQGGGFDESYRKKPVNPPIRNEADNGLVNEEGTLAMARTMVVDSATAQFFINVRRNPHLDHRSKDPRGFGYAVFGKVTKGMDVVKKIEAVSTGSCPGIRRDCPTTPVVIKSIKRKEPVGKKKKK